MTICYAVIDTNVLVSALLSKYDDTSTVVVLDKVLSGEVIPLLSIDIIKEYQDVLRRKKFSFPEELVDILLEAICTYGEVVIPKKSNEILSDINDMPFYEVVLSRQEDGAQLVTGNIRHFPKKPYIVTPSQFLSHLHTLGHQ